MLLLYENKCKPQDTQSSGYFIFLTDVWRSLVYVTREMSFLPEGPVIAFLLDIIKKYIFLLNILYL